MYCGEKERSSGVVIQSGKSKSTHLGDGVNDHISSKQERVLVVRTRESVVDHKGDPMLLCDFCDQRNRHQGKHGVGRSLGPDQLCLPQGNQSLPLGLNPKQERLTLVLGLIARLTL